MKVEVLYGPPGTGKTTTLLEYVDEELSRGTPPDRIGYVSFTRRATEEAVTRAMKKFKLERKQFPYFRTLHSMCFMGLGLRRSDVLTGEKLQKDFADYAGIKITGKWADDGTFSGMANGDKILHWDNMARVRCTSLRQEYQREDPRINWSEVEYGVKCLRAFKMAHGLLDYTDMLSEYVKQGLSPPDHLKALFVDEAQDLSLLQWHVVEALAKDCERVVIAGDDDQAIYQWAGADVNTMLQLEGESRVLNQSWRVPRQIQNLGIRLSNQIKNRHKKRWEPRNADGKIATMRDLTGVDFNGDDVLVLARNDFLMPRIESILMYEGIVYEKHGHPSIKNRYLEAAEHWTQLCRGDPITIDAARRVYGLMSTGRGVERGYKTLQGREDDELVTYNDLKSSGGLLLSNDVQWIEALDRIPRGEVGYMMRARRRGVKLRERPSVRLSTIHSAKGAEADHVVLLREMAKRSHKETELNPDDELRVWYVAVTRAREKLTLVDSSTYLECPWL